MTSEYFNDRNTFGGVLPPSKHKNQVKQVRKAFDSIVEFFRPIIWDVGVCMNIKWSALLASPLKFHHKQISATKTRVIKKKFES